MTIHGRALRRTPRVASCWCLGILVFLAAACSEATAPPTGGPLTGSWGTLPIPSGTYTELTLQSGGGRLQGAEQAWGVGPDAYRGSLVVTGTYRVADSSLSVWMMRGALLAATFIGRWSGDTLVGTWTDGSGSYAMYLERVPD